MIEAEERISAVFRTLGDDLRAGPTLGQDARRGARRRRTRTRIGVAAAVAVLAGAAGIAATGTGGDPHRPVGGTAVSPSESPSGPPGPPTSCRIDRLPTPTDVRMSLVTGGDRTGRHLLGRLYPKADDSIRYPLVIWVDGIPTQIDVPGKDQSLRDVNDAGTAVGSSFATDDLDSERPYMYRDGTVTQLRLDGPGEATAIGENGQIVGARTANGPLPVIWRDPTGPAADLPVPDGMNGRADDIDADGTVVGTLSGSGGGAPDVERGYLWAPDGTGRFLPVPTLDNGPATSVDPMRIRNGRVVVRVVAADDVTSYGVIDPDTGTFAPFPESRLFSRASTVLGWTAVDADRPYLATPSGPVDLPTLVPPPPGPPTPEPYQVPGTLVVWMSDDGHTMGGQTPGKGGGIQAVRWRCT